MAIASLALEQDSSYWQVRVLQPGAGRFRLGVSRFVDAAALEGETPLEWALDVGAGEEETGKDVVNAVKGDVFGVSFSQSDFPMLRFYANGRELEGRAVKRVRGLVFPSVQVMGEEEELAFLFHEDDWAHPPPSTRMIMILEAKSMI